MGIAPTIADARFAEPLDESLARDLMESHELVVTIEAGAVARCNNSHCATAYSTIAGYVYAAWHCQIVLSTRHSCRSIYRYRSLARGCLDHRLVCGVPGITPYDIHVDHAMRDKKHLATNHTVSRIEDLEVRYI
jgi:hypothetical protein